MTEEALFSLLQEAAALTLGRKLEGLTLDAHIAELGIDSVGLLEMVGVIEDRLGMRLADDQIVRIKTVRDMLTLVTSSGAEEPGPP